MSEPEAVGGWSLASAGQQRWLSMQSSGSLAGATSLAASLKSLRAVPPSPPSDTSP